MRKLLRTVLTVAAMVGAVISAGHHASTSRHRLDKEFAPVAVNVEIDKQFAADLQIRILPAAQETPLTPTGGENRLRQTVVSAVIKPTPIDSLVLALPAARAPETLSAITAISVFVGKKLWYFSPAQICRWSPSSSGDAALYQLPVGKFASSLFGDRLNYYKSIARLGASQKQRHRHDKSVQNRRSS